MRRILSFLLLVLLCSRQVRADERPNIVLMLSDDQGWDGLSVPMHPDVPASKSQHFYTPNLERLAARGMRFSNAYSPAPVCSPTRISLQTGKSPAQLHWTKAAPAETGQKLIEPRLIKSLASAETTSGEVLRGAGYATAHYGKWHIGGGGPGEHGYDEHDGDTGNEQAFKFHDPNPVDIFGMAQRAEEFMQKSMKAGKPFYIQLSWNALHASENANKATLAKYQSKLSGENEKRITTAAITEDLDTGVGKVIDSIDRLGLAKNTIIIYMSDNGSGGGGGGGQGGGKRAGLHGGKGGVWEGGIRVPFIIAGPTIEANSWSHTPIVGYDLLPTFCQWAHIDRSKLPARIEGGSIAEIVRNGGSGNVQRSNEGLVFHFPHYQGEGGPQTSIRVGDWKLIHFYEDGRDELYNLKDDLSERKNLATQEASQVKELHQQLEKYLARVDAQLPTKNPDFNPSNPPEPRKRGGKNNKAPSNQKTQNK
ncbi:MAG: sulfatase-like hydrolase/transferase [Pirellula sp.]